MYNLSNLKNKRKKFKRVGRGSGSGHGKTCCRGHKGQKSRSGGTKGIYFEGGQTPIYRRLPKKRGFTNLFSKEYKIINTGDLGRFEGEVSFAGSSPPVKILGGGELKKALKVTAKAFSKSAQAKIEAGGGEAVRC